MMLQQLATLGFECQILNIGIFIVMSVSVMLLQLLGTLEFRCLMRNVRIIIGMPEIAMFLQILATLAFECLMLNVGIIIGMPVIVMLLQLLATLAFECLMLNVGIIIGMPVIVIGALRLPGSDFTLTEDQASWFAGLIFVVQPIGSVVSGFLQDLLGRKLCMMLVNVPQLAAWLAIYHATSVVTLFFAVSAMGLSLGFMEAPVLSYIGEISEPRLRGVLSTLGGIFFNFGLMISAFIGASTDWRTMMLICAVTPVVAFLALVLVPDSPAWLVSKGRVRDAERAYQWLRGWVSPEAVREELETIVAYVKQSRQTTPRIVNSLEYKAVSTKEDAFNGTTDNHKPESQLKIFLHPSVQRPLRLITTFSFIAACASLTAIRPFLIEFLADLNLPVRPHLVIGMFMGKLASVPFSAWESHKHRVYGSGLVLLGSGTSTLLMRRVGKRGLTFWSLGLGVFCCLGLGLYLHLDLNMPWVALALICVSFFAPSLGMVSVPWILISEVFPLKGRGFASGVAAALAYLLMFIVIKTYYNLVSLVDVSGACTLYGTVGLLGMVYLYRNLPETEGVSLQDIERIFFDDRTKVATEKAAESDRQSTTVKNETEQNLLV